MPPVSASKYVVNATWDDVPHLDQQAKDEMLADTPIHLREARSKGVPTVGIGAIYPYDEQMIFCDPFPIPHHWAKCYALDVGWHKTAALWAALDRDSDIAYLYSEYYQGGEKPPQHASAIKARGEWIPGVIDPAARGRSQADGQKLFTQYQNEGLNIIPANNAVEAGIFEVQQRFETGRLKVFTTLTAWKWEWRMYRRDEKNTDTREVVKIVKKNDHLMDDTRYVIMSGLRRAITKPIQNLVARPGVVADGLGGY